MHTKYVAAFTRTELVVVTALLMLVIGVCLPWLYRPRKPYHSRCPSHLKNIGLAFRIWSTDNGDVYPMAKSTNAGGTKEYIGTTQVFRHFIALTNEIARPMDLVCPDASTPAATNWNELANTNIDYIVGVDAAANATGLSPRGGSLSHEQCAFNQSAAGPGAQCERCLDDKAS